MKKTMKTVVALMLVVFLALTMTAVAFAATMDDSGKVDTTDTTLIIPKGLTMKNAETGNYFSPNVTYTYTIAPVDPVANAAVGGLPVEKGPANSVSLANSNIVFTSALVNDVTSSGKVITEDITVNVDLTKFTKPGIYRYVLTDTTAVADLFAAGIVRSDDYDATRYIDVYVKYSGTVLTVYGYTLSKDNLVNTAGQKNGGFTPAPGSTDTDVYVTYNVCIEKKVDGSMGDKTHEFPFAITIDNGGLQYNYGKVVGSLTAGSAASLSANLKDGEVFYIRGLSPKATVAVTETNDTSDTYKVKIEGKTGTGSYTTLVAQADVAPSSTAALAAGAVSTYDTDNSATAAKTEATGTEYSNILFTNSLSDVSPTGLILRFAPFILMLGFAAVLIVIVRRNKGRKAQTSAI